MSESTLRLQTTIDSIDYDGPLDADPKKDKPFMPIMLCLKKEMIIANDGFKLARKEALRKHIHEDNQKTEEAYKKLGLAYISTAL